MNEKNKALIFGGADGDVGLVNFLKSRGFHVTTSGFTSEASCHSAADRYISCDIASEDEVRTRLDLGKYEIILPSCNDVAFLQLHRHLGYYSADKLNLVEQLMLKDQFRRLQKSLGLDSPATYELGDAVFPCLYKPNNLSGGRGVYKCNSDTDLMAAAKYQNPLAHLNGSFVIEEFVEGSSHGAFLFFLEGRLRFSFVDDEYYREGEFWVSATSWPSSTLTSENMVEIKRQANLLRESLGIDSCLLHLQLRVNKDRVVIIEATMRFPGDDYVGFIDRAVSSKTSAWAIALGLNAGTSDTSLQRFLSDVEGLNFNRSNTGSFCVRVVVKDRDVNDDSLLCMAEKKYGSVIKSSVWREDRMNRIFFVSTESTSEVNQFLNTLG